MSRNLDPNLSAALSNGLIFPVLMVMLTFRSATRYIWSGTGTIVSNSQTFQGVGSLGQIGSISEGVDVNAAGTTVSLSGIDPTLLGESMADIQLGAPAKIWFGLLSGGQLIWPPYLMFSGLVDKPTITTGATQFAISLALENRMVDLSRPSMRRYTSADQKAKYPRDISFDWVELLNDISLQWGQLAI